MPLLVPADGSSDAAGILERRCRVLDEHVRDLGPQNALRGHEQNLCRPASAIVNRGICAADRCAAQAPTCALSACASSGQAEYKTTTVPTTARRGRREPLPCDCYPCRVGRLPGGQVTGQQPLAVVMAEGTGSESDVRSVACRSRGGRTSRSLARFPLPDKLVPTTQTVRLGRLPTRPGHSTLLSRVLMAGS